MEIFKLLETSSAVFSFEVLDYKTWSTGFYIKMEIVIFDESILYVREYNDDEERNYSFHWQDSLGELILRWDNAPHYKWLKTFPHHLHRESNVEESTDITLSDVLKHIEILLESKLR